MTKIKICGMTCEAAIKAVNTYLPDYIGFVLFFPKNDPIYSSLKFPHKKGSSNELPLFFSLFRVKLPRCVQFPFSLVFPSDPERHLSGFFPHTAPDRSGW